jgi:hypothetical protein
VVHCFSVVWLSVVQLFAMPVLLCGVSFGFLFSSLFVKSIHSAVLHSLKMEKVNDYEICRFTGVMRYPESDVEEDNNEGEEAKKNAKKVEKRMMLYPMSVAERTLEGNQVQMIDGNEAKEDTAKNMKEAKEAGEGEGEEAGMWMGVGELKLSDVRGRLQRIGIRCEFQQGGLLVCEGDVTVSKSGQNHFSLEGVVGDRYYKIREILYQMLTYVQ